jgi:hypothetical protein
MDAVPEENEGLFIQGSAVGYFQVTDGGLRLRLWDMSSGSHASHTTLMLIEVKVLNLVYSQEADHHE